ncbi:EAL domain-containing protein [Aneurinibacillus sp. BA2021]|nr:EAL domain-containing protein [Aneurinibacillus sp. BA2021]
MPEKKKKPYYVIDSWERCRKAGLYPEAMTVPPVQMNSEELAQRKRKYEEVLSAIQPFFKDMAHMLHDRPLLLVVTDDKGSVLHIEGDAAIQTFAADRGVRVGTQCTEEAMGTNSICLALREKQPIQVVGDDHYYEFLYDHACYTAPFRYTDRGRLLGTVTIMTIVPAQNDFFLTLLSTVVGSIERELLLRRQNRQLDRMNHIMMDSTRNGIVITDRKGKIMKFNQFAEQMTGMRHREVIGRNVECLETIGQYMVDVLHHNQKHEDIEVVLYNQNASERCFCLFDALPILDRHQRIIGAFGLFRNITEQYEAEAKYNYLAYHDELTDLPNRQYFKRKIFECIHEAEQQNKQVAVFLIDLDRFKLINDTLGHFNGDMLLKEAGIRLKERLGSQGIVVRMSGDEFILLLPDVGDDTDLFSLAAQLLDAFKEPFIMNGYEFHITASMGAAIYPQDGEDAETLLVHADTAMYSAKENGKNKCVFFTETMDKKPHERILMETSMHHALKNEEFILHYQPQIDIRTGNISGVEALVRWRHPEFGLVPPNTFIPIAEETGLIVPMGEWVMRQACQQNKRWQQLGLPTLRVAVNLSMQQFLTSNLVDTVRDILEETGLDASCLELEITETMTMDVEYAIPTLKQLHKLGVQISIDDFGTGYSSLNYLKKFAIHRLKIDQSFVRDIMTDPNDASIVETIISMAHNLGLSVIAEGVEEEQQLLFLQRQQCDEVQGYYFSKPVSAADFESRFTDLQQAAKKSVALL